MNIATPSPFRSRGWHHHLALLSLLLGLLPWRVAVASDSTPETKREMARLPAYCAARLGPTEDPAYKRWESVIGPNFIHIHHYCFALHKRFTARAKPDPTERNYWLNSTMKEFDYVEQHAQGPLMLYPEMFTERGRIYLELGDVASASRYFARALKTDPAYGRAYAAMADLYLKQGKRDKAKQLLEQGLAADPGSKSLQKRLARLNANKSKGVKPKPAPEPMDSPGATSASETPHVSEAAASTADTPKPSEAEASVTPSPVPTSSDPTDVATDPAP